MCAPRDVGEVIDKLTTVLLNSPNFEDKTGYFPFKNIEWVFQQLNGGLNNIRETIEEARHHELMRMSAQIRALFEADPEDKTGETAVACRIIHEMEDILRGVDRKSRSAERRRLGVPRYSLRPQET